MPKPCCRADCASEGAILPDSAFYLDPRAKDGLRSACIECVRRERRAAYWRAKAPCVRCGSGQRMPWSRLCSDCEAAASVVECQARGCARMSIPGARWCAAHTPVPQRVFDPSDTNRED